MEQSSQPSRLWPLIAAGLMILGALGLVLFGRGMYDSLAMLLEAGPDIAVGVFVSGWATLAAAVFAIGAILLAGGVAFGRAAPSPTAGVGAAVCAAGILVVGALVMLAGLQILRVFSVIAASAIAPRADEIAPHVYSSQDWMQGVWIGLFLVSLLLGGVLAGTRWRRIDRGSNVLALVGVIVTVLGALPFVAAWLFSGLQTSGLLDALVAEPTPRPSDLAGYITSALRGGVVAGASLAVTGVGLGCVLLAGSRTAESTE